MEPWRGTDERPEYPDLARILATARRWWWALLLGALAGAALALAAGGNSAVSYQASTRLLVGPIGGEYSLLRAAGQQAQTYADLATSQPVVLATRARLGAAASPDGLRRHVSAQADDVSRLLTITAQASRPEAAARLANTLAEELQRVTRATVPQSANELRVVEPAQAPQSPVQGHARMLVVLAALAGLLAVLTVLVMADLARGRVATESELAAASPAPVLGTAGRDPTTLTRAMGLLGDGRRRIVIAGVDDDGEGTRAARALVAAIAASGSHAVLVDADPRTSAGGPRPRIRAPPRPRPAARRRPRTSLSSARPRPRGFRSPRRGRAAPEASSWPSAPGTPHAIASPARWSCSNGPEPPCSAPSSCAARFAFPAFAAKRRAPDPPAGTAGEVRPA